MVLHAPLDIEYWFFNVFSESQLIFTILGLITLAFISAKLKMSGGVFMILTIMFGGIVLAIGQNWILGIALFIGAPILYWLIRRTTE